ncbi:hypothetical protein LCGC14_0400940 [marine sediment metagenome]|uniref:Uncharacterized protein n=1 Tax=marine sediment metagenome TaxID=412755 RepID=A0A0F9VIQ9_9ZZZZ
MADLTADAPLRLWSDKRTFTERWGVDSSVARTIYKGQPMIIDLTVDTLFLAQFVDAVVVAATDIFIGVAAEGMSVASGDTEGDDELIVYVDGTILGFKSTVFTDADVGDTVYMSDSAVLSATAADNPELGLLHRVVDGYAYVQLITPSITTAA